ncbi:MAG: lysophospholipid acyltransferase family protein [Ktedonobacteraceae bacterium]
MYRLYRFGSIVIPRLPLSFVRFLSLVIGFVAWLFARRARKQATINMQHVLGTQGQSTRAGRKKLRSTVRKMFLYSARNYLDTLRLPYLKPEEVLDRIRHKEGLEHLDAALAQGKGAILFTAHFGPFEYVAQWFAFSNYALTIPVEHLEDERMLELTLKLRSGQGVQFVPLGGSAAVRAMISTLRKNQLVVIPVDRAIQGESVEKDFFGAPARLSLGPVSLAIRTGAALIGAFGWYMPDNSIGGCVVPASLALSEDERNDSDKLMEKVVETLEANISARPEQWVMFSPLWTKDIPTP